MRSLVLTLIYSLLMPLSARALETDNYHAWNYELADSSALINQLLNERVVETLKTSQAKTCRQVTAAIAKNFASYFVHDDPITDWLMPQLTPEQVRPLSRDYVSESIYRDPFRFYIPRFGLAPNIQVNDFYFGLDKLSHFGATGKLYLDAYQKALRSGADEASALARAIDHGLQEENTVYGYWASGVFSYADLEANFQGLRFYQRLCDAGAGSYLQQDQSKTWSLVQAIDIADYVNAHWDETFNPSYFLPGNWRKIAPVLQANYCSLRHTRLVQERFLRYQKSQRSFSVEHLSALRAMGHRHVPDPSVDQSLEQLCL